MLAAAFSLLPDLRAQAAWNVGQINLPNVLGTQDIAYGKGRFVAALNRGGGPMIAWSTDGIHCIFA